MEKRLDSGLSNQLWQASWLNTMVTHSTVFGSDHCPIIIQCDPRMIASRRLFQFQAFWANEDECKRLVEECWARPCGGVVLDCWHKRINDYRSQPIRWSRYIFKQREQEIVKLTSELGELKKKLGCIC